MRFTIRDLLWLTALVAVMVAWRIDWNNRADERLTSWISQHAYPPRSHNEPHPLQVSNPLMAQFTIRDLLWLTVVVALGASLWLNIAKRDEQWRTFFLRAMKEEARHEPFTLTTPAGEKFDYVPDRRRPILVDRSSALEKDDHIFGTPNPSAPATNPPSN
jgi:hypothetical protein